MISVIVVTYNQAPYLAQTLDSILGQEVEGEELEVIIGNDASTDGTGEMAERYRVEHPQIVRVLNQPTNLGLLDNFIACIRAARGEYIALCDGDDYWVDTRKLLKESEVMRQDSSVVLVHTNRSFLADKRYEAAPLDDTVATNPADLFFQSYICVPTVMVRTAPVKDYLDRYEQLAHSQDWRMQDLPLWLHLGLQGRFAYLKEETAVYRVVSNTLSREQNKSKAYRFDKSVLRIKLHFYPLYAPLQGKGFRVRCKEMEFHTRKRMLRQYGRLAKEQIVPLLRLLPYWPIILSRSIYHKVKSFL